MRLDGSGEDGNPLYAAVVWSGVVLAIFIGLCALLKWVL